MNDDRPRPPACAPRPPLLRVALVVVCALVVGCGRDEPVYEHLEELKQTRFGFVQNGSTTREQLITTLGEPSFSFEQGRIMTWRLRFERDKPVPVLRKNPGGDLEKDSWPDAGFNLICVFEEGGVLCRNSLLRVR